jgi:hypothetical protein
MILFRLGEESFHFPHSLGQSLAKLGVAHAALQLVE